MAEQYPAALLEELLRSYTPSGAGDGVVLTDPRRSAPGFFRPNGDLPWHLPEAMVGDLPYRYQGVALHGAIAGLVAMEPISAYAEPRGYRPVGIRGLVNAFGGRFPFLGFLGNAGYALGTIAAGRTAPKPRITDPAPANNLPEILRNRYGQGYEDQRLGMDSADYDTRNVLARMP